MKTDAMRPLTISLSPQQLSRIQQAVETGAYASNSEVLREALRLWEQREELRMLEVARLRKAYEEGIASGPGQDGDEAFDRIRARINAATRQSA
ncbi:MAG: type II toxin-antitoxin system ParD family antitoxin [Beijerinckiaceae bacterium]